MLQFSFGRTWRVVRWEAITTWKQWFRIYAGSTICAFLFYEMMLMFVRKSTDTFALEAQYYSLAVCSLLAVVLMITASGAFICSGMKTKQQRLTFLMLPASTLEKFTANYLLSLLGIAAIAVAAVVSADLLRFALDKIIGPAGNWSVVKTIFELANADIYDAYTEGHSWLICAFCLSCIAAAHAFFCIGGTLFRRFQVMSTVALSIVFWFVLACFAADFPPGAQDAEGWAFLQIMTVWNFIMGAVYLCVAYWLFSRKGVICNRFIEI